MKKIIANFDNVCVMQESTGVIKFEYICCTDALLDLYQRITELENDISEYADAQPPI